MSNIYRLTPDERERRKKQNERKARHRERQKQGLVCRTIEVMDDDERIQEILDRYEPDFHQMILDAIARHGI